MKRNTHVIIDSVVKTMARISEGRLREINQIVVLGHISYSKCYVERWVVFDIGAVFIIQPETNNIYIACLGGMLIN